MHLVMFIVTLNAYVRLIDLDPPEQNLVVTKANLMPEILQSMLLTLCSNGEFTRMGFCSDGLFPFWLQ